MKRWGERLFAAVCGFVALLTLARQVHDGDWGTIAFGIGIVVVYTSAQAVFSHLSPDDPSQVRWPSKDPADYH